MRGSLRYFFVLVASLLLSIAVPAARAVTLSVGGTMATPCAGSGSVTLGTITITVNSSGIIPANTYLTVMVTPAILTSTPTASGSLAAFGSLSMVNTGTLGFLFSSNTNVLVGDSLTISGMTGNAPSTPNTYVTATVYTTEGSIAFLGNPWVWIAYVTGACGGSGHIAVSPASLAFGGPPHSLFPAQTFTVTNSTQPGQNLNISVSSVYPLGAPYAWLIPSAGTESAGVTLVTVSVDGSALGQGDYTAQVRVDSSYADNSPQFVNVTLKIGKPGRIDLSATSMSFVAAPGKNPPSQSLIIKNGGTGILAPDAQALSQGGGWLFVVPPENPLEATAVFDVRVYSLNMRMGTYKGQIIITSDNAFNSPQTVDVTLTIKDPTPTIALSPQAMTFQADQGVNPPAQTLNIVNSDTGDLAWQAQATTSDGGKWLAVSAASGTAPSAVSVSVNSASLLPGTYTGLITVTSGSANITNSPQTASVTLTVSAATPAIGVTVSSLSFVADAGGNPAAQSFTVNNTGTGGLAWAAAVATASGGSWLSVTPTSGSSGTVVQVTVNSAALPTGAYSGTITISSSSPGVTIGTVTIAVSLVVRSTTPVTIVNPSSLTFSSTPGGAAPEAQTVSLINGGPGTLSWAATVTTSDGGNWLVVSPLSGATPGTLTVMIDNNRLSYGKFTGSILIKATGAPDVTIPVTFTTGSPKITDGGVVNAAHQASVGLSPGGLITIFGSDLASATKPALPIPYLPDQLGGSSVSIGTFKAKLLFVSPKQINALVPVELTSETAQVKVSVSGLETDAVTLKVMPYDPGLFTFDGSPAGPAAALRSDFSAISTTAPAQRGSVIMLFGTGFGPVNPSVPSGQPAPSSTLSQTVQAPVVLFGDRPGRVLFSGLAPGLMGVYQVSVEVPADAPTGDAVSVVVGIGGRGTNYAKIAIR